MTPLAELLLRGLLLRCPVCGQGHLFEKAFTMYRQCPVCHFTYEREEGYFTSSMAIDLILSELLVTAFAVPLAANQSIPLLPLLLWGLPFTIILPILFYWHSRGLMMAMDHYLHPVFGNGSSHNMLPGKELDDL